MRGGRRQVERLLFLCGVLCDSSKRSTSGTCSHLPSPLGDARRRTGADRELWRGPSVVGGSPPWRSTDDNEDDTKQQARIAN